jgi:hypothetical protein
MFSALLVLYLNRLAGAVAKTGRERLSMANHSDNDKSVYKGPERRKFVRRTVSDRRKEVRWEPKNPNRRHSAGRRSADHLGVQGRR